MEPSSIFSFPARGFRHRREVLAGSLGPPEGERSTGARNRNLPRRARLAPSLDRPAGSNCRAPDSSGYIGERRSRRQSEFSYFKNERTRAVSHLYGPASMLSPSLFARMRTIYFKFQLRYFRFDLTICLCKPQTKGQQAKISNPLDFIGHGASLALEAAAKHSSPQSSTSTSLQPCLSRITRPGRPSSRS